MEYHLERFVTAQQAHYPRALQEIKSGRKQSCWMWYVFPQIAGLGQSETARYYAIRNMDEARAYMQNAALRNNLIEISKALLDVDSEVTEEVVKELGQIDGVLKIRVVK